MRMVISVRNVIFLSQTISQLKGAQTERFDWWVAPCCQRVEWKCATINNGAQCVEDTYTAASLHIQMSSADSLDIHLMVQMSTSTITLGKEQEEYFCMHQLFSA